MITIIVVDRDVHVLGIRSKTKLTARVLKEAKNLIVIGCFCIGTNQVDLQYAADHGIAVFNSPFSNSRSVAELVIAEIIALARQLGDRSNEMHHGTWNKVSNKCWEIRGKTLGKPSQFPLSLSLSPLSLCTALASDRRADVNLRYYWIWSHRCAVVGIGRGHEYERHFL